MLTRSIKLAALATLIIFASFARASAQTPVASANTTPPIIKAMPTLRLKGVDGKTYDIAEMRGQIVLASFGGTWCMPCAVELEALESLKREYANKPVRFLWISIDDEDASDALIKTYARNRKLTMPVLRDPQRAAFTQFAQRVRIPMVVYFDQEGRLASPPQFGMSDPDMYKDRVRDKLDELLKAAKNTQQNSTATTTTTTTMLSLERSFTHQAFR